MSKRLPESDGDTTLAGGGSTIVGPAEEAVEREKHARHGGQAEIVRWLFTPESACEIDPEAVKQAVQTPENLVWIDLHNYQPDDLIRLGHEFGLKRQEVESAFSSWQRPRLEVHGDHFFVSGTVARLSPHSPTVYAGELDLFVGENYLISAHKADLPFQQRILTRARQNPEIVRLDSAYMLYIVLDELLTHFVGLYEHVEADVERMEERALMDTSDVFLEDLLSFKRLVTALDRLVQQHRPVFAAFLRPDFQFVGGDDVSVYYRDLEGRLGYLLERLGVAREAITSSFDVYVSQMAHRTNQIIKILTIVSTVVLPVSIIVGFFSTSFNGLPIYGHVGFVVMVVTIVVLISGVLLAFRRWGWL